VVGSGGLLLVSSPAAICGVGSGQGELRLGGGSWRLWPLLAAGCAAPRHASPLGVAVRVWACLAAREVDSGGGTRPDSLRPAAGLLAAARVAGSGHRGSDR
jgi:hypothetical protein